MGNRAVITTSTSKTTGVGIYVHWNGGPESVLAFIHAARERGYRDPAGDDQYAMARLCGLICEFFNGTCGVGIGQLKELDTDNWDNGVYVIGEGWEIASRWGRHIDAVMRVEALDAQQREKYEQIKASLLKEATA